MSVLLEILIPTVPQRAEMLKILEKELMSQIHKSKQNIIVSTYSTEPFNKGGLPVGIKRQNLLNDSKGEYVVFFDDDDFPTGDYIEEVVKALESKPDVVTFGGWLTTDGYNRVEWQLKHGSNHVVTGDFISRPPNHVCPIKREIAVQIGYQSLNFGEDHDYCERLKQSRLIKTSVHIDKPIYYYDYRTTNKLY